MHPGGLGRDLRQAGPRFGALQRDHGPLVGDVAATDGRNDIGGVRGVRHDVEPFVVDPPHDDVVDHEPVLVEQMGVLGPPRVHPGEVVAQRVLQMAERVSALHAHRAEVADIESDCRGAAGSVLGHRPRRIGQRHLPTAERDHLGPEREVRRMER